MEIKPRKPQQSLAHKKLANEWPSSWNDWHHNPIIFVLFTGITHIFGVYGLEAILGGEVKLYTVICALVTAEASMFGVTAGAHRYWSHRSYKAKTPLRVLLAACFIISGQHTIWLWVAWHRVHHKHVDTDSDPHNSNRGFFYSHIGWFVLYDYELFRNNLSKINMSDVESDPIARFHEMFFIPLLIASVLLPSSTVWYLSGDPFYTCVCVDCLRVTLVFHRTFLINSAAHMFGSKPYDISIKAVQNKLVAFIASGEGWHNYHHVFPWDYKSDELGLYRWNFSTALIDLFALIGWAYDLKSVSKETVMRRMERTGTGNIGKNYHFESGLMGSEP